MGYFKKTERLCFPPLNLVFQIIQNIFFQITQGIIGILTGLVYGLLFVLGACLLFHYQIYYECGNSMENVLQKGSLLIVKNSKQTDYAIGDIITFTAKDQGKNICVTHRIQKITASGQYFTKGDANYFSDQAPVSKENIKGVVVGHIPYYGYLCRLLRKHSFLLLTFFMLQFLYGALPPFFRKQPAKCRFS